MGNYRIAETHTGRLVNNLIYHNKKNAISDARIEALARKQSCTVYKEGVNEDYAITICKFPYYLRNCKLDIKDIYVNKI